MLRESAAIVSLCARRRLWFACRISSTEAAVRSRYCRTERIISAGGNVKATRPAVPICSYAIVAASATGPNSAKWKRAQWNRSNQIFGRGCALREAHGEAEQTVVDSGEQQTGDASCESSRPGSAAGRRARQPHRRARG